MAKHAAARLRRMGLLSARADWLARVRICQSCPLCTTSDKQLFCGKPFLKKPFRDETVDGCGCPLIDKARAADEHCPIDPLHQPRSTAGRCNCKWCSAGV